MKHFLTALILMTTTVSTPSAAEDSPPQQSTKPTLPPLSEMQDYVVKHDGTEPPFQNEYWDHKEEGIYVDVQSGEALFSSQDKFDSGTGWPSFTKPIDAQNVEKADDYKLGVQRTEVRSKTGDSHLGHVFSDGPADEGGQRFCINSAALRFVPKAELKTQGYGQYLHLFE